MAGTSQPLLDKAFTFPGDQSTAGSSSYILLPDFLRGHFVEMIVYAKFSTAAAAGKLQIQTAPTADYAGTWANVGSTIDWSAGDKVSYGAVTGVFGSVRVAITTTVTSGTVSCHVVCSSGN